MTKSFLLLASLLVALAGPVHAQAPAAPNDPVVQKRLEWKEADKAYSAKKSALTKERNAKIKAAGDAAFADAKAKGGDPAIARRDAEAKVKSSTKADYDSKMKVLKKEHSDALAVIKKKYPAATS